MYAEMCKDDYGMVRREYVCRPCSIVVSGSICSRGTTYGMKPTLMVLPLLAVLNHS